MILVTSVRMEIRESTGKDLGAEGRFEPMRVSFDSASFSPLVSFLSFSLKEGLRSSHGKVTHSSSTQFCVSLSRKRNVLAPT
jgi:hypothetical protein